MKGVPGMYTFVLSEIQSTTLAVPARDGHRQANGRTALSEAAHFHKCEACGGWLNMRDFGAVLGHEEPLPHPACD